MIVRQELVRRIKGYFNLNIYETKVWLALLSKGVASAGEIAVISEVPRSRTYDVLESLEKRGFAIVKIGKPVKYIAVKPVEVLEKMKSATMQDAQERVNNLSVLKESNEYDELEKLYKNGVSPVKTQEIAGSIKGRSNVLNRLRELVQSAGKEIVISTSVADFEDKSRVLIPALEDALKKNVKIRIALSGPVEKMKKLKPRLNEGFKVNLSKIDSRAFISDKKEVLFMITPENGEQEIGVWLNSPFFAQSLSGMLSNSLRNGKG